jgi:hypothetical protein
MSLTIAKRINMKIPPSTTRNVAPLPRSQQWKRMECARTNWSQSSFDSLYQAMTLQLVFQISHLLSTGWIGGGSDGSRVVCGGDFATADKAVSLTTVCSEDGGGGLSVPEAATGRATEAVVVPTPLEIRELSSTSPTFFFSYFARPWPQPSRRRLGGEW